MDKRRNGPLNRASGWTSCCLLFVLTSCAHPRSVPALQRFSASGWDVRMASFSVKLPADWLPHVEYNQVGAGGQSEQRLTVTGPTGFQEQKATFRSSGAQNGDPREWLKMFHFPPAKLFHIRLAGLPAIRVQNGPTVYAGDNTSMIFVFWRDRVLIVYEPYNRDDKEWKTVLASVQLSSTDALPNGS